MPVISLWTREGGVLGAVGPLGLAAAAGTALVVDLDQNGPSYPGDVSLADLCADGPTARDLKPSRSGVAVLRNGGVSAEDAEPVIRGLVAGWPAVVLRLSPVSLPPPSSVQLHPQLPGGLFPEPEHGRAVYQASAWRRERRNDAIVLPRPRRSTLTALLTGQTPALRDRWIRAWARVWSDPWT